MLGVRCFISAITASCGLRSAPRKSFGVYAATASSSWSEPSRNRRRCRSIRASSTRRLRRSSVTLRDSGPPLQDLAGPARVDRLRGESQPVLPVPRQADRAQRRRRVQKDHVPPRPLGAADHLARQPGVLLRAAAAHRLDRGVRQSQLGRVELIFLALPIDLDHERGGHHRQLVHPVGRVKDDRPLHPETDQHLGHLARQLRVRHTGPSTLNTVRRPRSLRGTAAKRNDGWKIGAKRNPMPASSMHLATPSGCRSIFTPSCSRTSADPHIDEAARFPCLATRAPHAAETIAASVEMLNVASPSPPVPHVSSSAPSTWIGVATALAARAKPVSSSTVSPFMRSATTKPA